MPEGNLDVIRKYRDLGTPPATLVEIMTRDEQMLPRITDLRNKNTGDEAILDIMVGQRSGIQQPVQQPIQESMQESVSVEEPQMLEPHEQGIFRNRWYQAPEGDLSIDEVIHGVAFNLLPSLGREVKAITWDLPKTLPALGAFAKELVNNKAGTGLIGLTAEEKQQKSPLTMALVQHYRDTYGNIENLKRYLAENPAAVAGDLATAFSGLGAAAGITKVGATAAKAGKVASVAAQTRNVANTISRAVEPLTWAMEGAKAATWLPRKALGTAGFWGLKTATNVPSEALRVAARTPSAPGLDLIFKKGRDFRAARGGVFKAPTKGPEEILGTVQEMMETVKKHRGDEYRSKLDEITNANPAEASRVEAALSSGYGRMLNNLKTHLKDEFGINVVRNLDPDSPTYLHVKADTSRSTLPHEVDLNMIENAVDKLWNDWGTRQQDFTVKGLDTLKRRMDNYVQTAATDGGRLLANTLRDNVRKLLESEVVFSVRNKKGNKVPTHIYRDMTAQYADYSGVIDEIQQALKVGTKANIETAMNAVTSLYKGTQYKKGKATDLMSLYSEATGQKAPDLEELVSGYLLSGWEPKRQLLLPMSMIGAGIISRIATPGWLGTFAALLSLSSPKIVSLMLTTVFGLPKHLADKFVKSLALRSASRGGARIAEARPETLEETPTTGELFQQAVRKGAKTVAPYTRQLQQRISERMPNDNNAVNY